MNEPILQVKNLVKSFPLKKKGFFKKAPHLTAVNGISFDLKRGETLGLVGESGCGKTTAGRAVLRLIEPTSGVVNFEGRNVAEFDGKELKEFRKTSQMVFQDPFASLNPRMTVGEIIAEPLLVHGLGTRAERRERAASVLKKVGLEPEYMHRFPHEFSGGQRQRIGIARVLTLNPRFIVADEPVSALDVSIQAQIMNLLVGLQEEFRISYLFISHDLAVVEHLAHRVAVMYLGRIVETAAGRSLYGNPRHPYTKALLSSIPLPDPKMPRERKILLGDIPNPSEPPSGCTFRTRCSLADEICRREIPDMVQVGEDHYAACHALASSQAFTPAE